MRKTARTCTTRCVVTVTAIFLFGAMCAEVFLEASQDAEQQRSV